jgi:hypothetical protein
MISYSAGKYRAAESRACGETAILWSIRSSRKPHNGIPSFDQPSSPAGWNVAQTSRIA